MKTITIKLLLSLFALLIIQACTIEKRIHRPGYRVEWKKGHKSSSESNSKMKLEETHSLAENKTVPEEKFELVAIESITTESPNSALVERKQLNENTPYLQSDSPQVIEGEHLESEKEVPELQAENEPFDEPMQTSKGKRDEKDKGASVTSLVLGILGILTLGYLGIVFGPLAIIFGARALKKIRQNPDVYGGQGMAKAGLILGIIACAMLLLAIVIILMFLFGYFYF